MDSFTRWFSKKVNEPTSLILNIKLGDKLLAKLFHDGKSYCLQYTKDFPGSGIAPFNPSDLEKGSNPVVGQVYRSSELWNAFASRLPSPSRDDFKPLLDAAGLHSDEESLLRVLAKVGSISISKPWRIEVGNDDQNSQKRA